MERISQSTYVVLKVFEFARLPWPSFHIIEDVAGASHNMVQGMVQGNSLACDAYLPHVFGIWPLI